MNNDIKTDFNFGVFNSDVTNKSTKVDNSIKTDIGVVNNNTHKTYTNNKQVETLELMPSYDVQEETINGNPKDVQKDEASSSGIVPIKVDLNKVAVSASDALNGNFVDKDNLIESIWNSDSLTFEKRDDGTYLIRNGGVPIGFTTIDSVIIPEEEPVEEVKPKKTPQPIKDAFEPFINTSTDNNELIELSPFETITEDGPVEFGNTDKIVSSTTGASYSEVGSSKKSFFSNLLNNYFKARATVATTGISIIEGSGKTAENTAKALNLIGGGLLSIGTGLIDVISGNDESESLTRYMWEEKIQKGNPLMESIQYVMSEAPAIKLLDAAGKKIKGDEWDSYSDYLKDRAKNAGNNDGIEESMDFFYEGTNTGTYLKNNSFVFDTNRNISSSVGQVLGVLGLGYLTAGVGGALGGTGAAATAAGTGVGTGATAASTSGISSFLQSSAAILKTQGGKVLLSSIAGIKGFGSNTYDAWDDGATLEEGTLVGGAAGLFEGLQYFVGSKINEASIFKETVPGVALEFKKEAANVGLRVGADSVDGALEGFIRPLINMLYKDGYNDETGAYVSFDKNTSLSDKYLGLFEENGGWKTVGTNALMGAGMSFLSEVSGLAKSLRSDKNITPINDDFSKMLDDNNSEMIQKQLRDEMKMDIDVPIKDGDVVDQIDLNKKIDPIDDKMYSAEVDDTKWFTKQGANGKVDSAQEVKVVEPIDAKVDNSGRYATVDLNTPMHPEVMPENGVYTPLEGASKEPYKPMYATNEPKKVNVEVEPIKETDNNIKNDDLNSFNVEKNKMDSHFVGIEDGISFYGFKSAKELTSSMLEQVDDLSKTKVMIMGGLIDESTGQLKLKYQFNRYYDRVTYTGTEALDIVRRLEELESMIDMSLSTKERARQIYEIVSDEFSYNYNYNDIADGHKITSSLRGITANNSFGKEGLVCAGYAQVYKELCDRAGIKCEYIHGTGITSKNAGMHAWNVVIDDNGDIIPVDCTWRSGSKNDWFGLSEKFQKSHIADDDEIYRNYLPK